VMAKKKQEPDKILGHDPFAGMDLEWMEQEESKPSLKALGHDPLEGMDVTGLDEPPPALAREVRPVPRAAEAAPARPPRPQATFHFPADFKWGVATAAHQVEGNNTNNDWWAWEQQDNRIREGHKSKKACNWWENAEADFDRAADMGLNALRLSVEWSRVEPRPGEFDDSALKRYGEMLQGLRERGIEPMVTLHHFTNPSWLAEQGGWENPETVALFAHFARRVVETLGQHCDLWCTINELNVYGYLGYLEGIWPPGKSDRKTAISVIRCLLEGHAAAYQEIHAVQPKARVGLAHNMRIFDPADPHSSRDRRVAQVADRAYNQAILDALTRGRWTLPLGFGLARNLRHTLDWIGLNYYTRDLVAFDRAQRETLFSRRLHAEDAELLDGGYGEFYPQGIFRSLQRLARPGLPVYVTENGVPDEDDDQRPRYLLTHLHQVWHAIQLCYPVMGYYHWTLVDNFEWAEGWTLRFGLIALNLKNKSRKPRRSAELYAGLIRANAITPQIIDTYAPELRAELLPG
jgi:beta-glucosidase